MYCVLWYYIGYINRQIYIWLQTFIKKDCEIFKFFNNPPPPPIKAMHKALEI